MKTNHFSLGPVPTDESCQQVGMPSYNSTIARQECQIYIRQLKRQFSNAPSGVSFEITENPHDFGTYLDVVIRFNENVKAEMKYALIVENNLPALWDKIANNDLDKLI
jgi:hypothetical protein